MILILAFFINDSGAYLYDFILSYGNIFSIKFIVCRQILRYEI